ncbi:hypothetical protein C5F31_23975, partial [Escherichia coli]
MCAVADRAELPGGLCPQSLTAQVLANTGSGLVQAATLLLDVVNTVNGGRVLATGSADVKG